MAADAQQVLDADCHVIGLLNELEAVLGGWVLRFDDEWVRKTLGPIYAELDMDVENRKHLRD